jgi:hypothetical protein
MKCLTIFSVATLAMAAVMIAPKPVSAQDEASCKAYFQVLRAKPGTPGLQPGMDSGQKRWWENTGRKKYPGLCLSGCVTSNDKPRYLVIWSNSKSIGRSTVPTDQIYGERTNTLQRTAPKEWIYQPRWNVASVTILTVSYDNGLELPPVYIAPAKRMLRVLWPSSAKVLEAAVKYLDQEPEFSLTTSQRRIASDDPAQPILSGENAPEEEPAR